MKRTLFLVITMTITLVLLPLKIAFASEMSTGETLLYDIYNDTNAKELLTFDEDNVFSEITGYPDLKSTILAMIKGEYRLSLQNIMQLIKELSFKELKNCLQLVITISVLCILYSLLSSATSSYLNENIKTSVFCAAFLSLCILLSNAVFASIQSSSAVINSLVSFMNAFIPFLLLFLSMGGGINTTAMLSPTLLFFTNLVTYIINSVIIPISTFGFIMTMADKLLSSVNITYLCSFIKKGCLFLLGACFTIFGGIVAFEGFAFSSLDGVAVKTAKYTLNTLVPVVGGFLSDSADTINGFLIIIKNSFGIVGVILICCIAFTPVIKLLCVFLSLRLSSIIIQPIANERLSQIVDAAASYLFFITTCVTACGVMFIIICGLLIYFGNYMLMLR